MAVSIGPERTSRTPLKQFHCMCNIKLGPPQAPVGCVPWLLLWSQSLVTVRGQRPPRCTTRQIFLEKISPVEGVWAALRMHSIWLDQSPYHLGPGKAHTVSRLLSNLTLWFCSWSSVSESCLSPICQAPQRQELLLTISSLPRKLYLFQNQTPG